MKVIGLIGGISWVSTLDYYRIMNEEVNRRLGGGNGARMLISSLNYEEVIGMNNSGRTDELLELIRGEAQKLEQGGAQCLLLGANTMHRFAKEVQEVIHIPLIHIAEETAKEIVKRGFACVSLLGTKFTMEMDFFKDKLAAHGIRVLVPSGPDREFIHQTIFGELGKSIFKKETRERYLSIMEGLQREGAEGAILGCTEIPLLVKPGDTAIPLLDTTAIHSLAAVNFALS